MGNLNTVAYLINKYREEYNLPYLILEETTLRWQVTFRHILDKAVPEWMDEPWELIIETSGEGYRIWWDHGEYIFRNGVYVEYGQLESIVANKICNSLWWKVD